MIYVYNRTKEDFSFSPNNYYIGRGGILGNPYSWLPDDKCIAIYKCKNRDESLEKYSKYFDMMYGANKEFTKIINEIYEKYKNGEDIFLECYCKKYSCLDKTIHDDEVSCHGDIIARKLQQMLIREKLREAKENRRKENA